MMDLFDLQAVASREAKAGLKTGDMGDGALLTACFLRLTPLPFLHSPGPST